MTLLDRYLAKLFSKHFLFVLTTLLVMFLINHFFEVIDDFMRAGLSLSMTAEYFLLKTPQMIEELTPIAILLSGIITFGLINHHGGVLVLRSAGIHTVRITIPLIATAVIFSVGTLALAEWIVPPTTAKTDQILFEKVKKEKPKGIERNGRFFYSDDRGFYSFESRGPDQNQFEYFSFAAWDSQYNLRLLLSARKAFWDDGAWTLVGGLSKQRDESGNYTINFFKKEKFNLKATPEDFFTPVYKIDEMALSDLYFQGNKGDRLENTRARLKFFERFSFIILGIPLLLLGLPILMLAHQKWRRDISLAIPISFGLALAVWGGWGAMQSLAKGGVVNPPLAAWSVHLLTGTLGFILILRQDK